MTSHRYPEEVDEGWINFEGSYCRIMRWTNLHYFYYTTAIPPKEVCDFRVTDCEK